MRIRCLKDRNFSIEAEDEDREKYIYIKNDGSCSWNSGCGIVLQFHFKNSIEDCI